MPALARFLILLIAGFVTAASIGELVPHVSWLVETYGISLGAAGALVSLHIRVIRGLLCPV